MVANLRKTRKETKNPKLIDRQKQSNDSLLCRLVFVCGRPLWEIRSKMLDHQFLLQMMRRLLLLLREPWSQLGHWTACARALARTRILANTHTSNASFDDSQSAWRELRDCRNHSQCESLIANAPNDDGFGNYQFLVNKSMFRQLAVESNDWLLNTLTVDAWINPTAAVDSLTDKSVDLTNLIPNANSGQRPRKDFTANCHMVIVSSHCFHRMQFRSSNFCDVNPIAGMVTCAVWSTSEAEPNAIQSERKKQTQRR